MVESGTQLARVEAEGCRALPKPERLRRHLVGYGLERAVPLHRAMDEGSFKLDTAYPFAAAGVKHRLIIEAIEEWENGIEAVLHVSFDGAQFAFFDTRYFENKYRHQEG